MAHIETTIWDLAMAFGDEDAAATKNSKEATDLAFCALANLLANARLVDCESEVPDAVLDAVELGFEAAG